MTTQLKAGDRVHVEFDGEVTGFFTPDILLIRSDIYPSQTVQIDCGHATLVTPPQKGRTSTEILAEAKTIYCAFGNIDPSIVHLLEALVAEVAELRAVAPKPKPA